ncbi:MAG: LysR substrate-binding domain-containing protein [Marivibrio sp.]|uniref:LysR substrate-binding domain-containing protein n=1 Tax=Marivibrio sp. TaxID=2039719 RepID=UPI0032EADDE0
MAVRYTLRQLEYFVAVGEAGGIAPAAAKLNVSAPSISTAISQLEAALGVALFVRRHAQGLALTAGGRRLYKAARALLDGAEALHAQAAEIADLPSGPISVGCLQTLAPTFLPAVRRRFEARHPHALFRQHEAHQEELFRMIRAAEIDAALTYELEIPADIAFEPLADLPPYVVLAPDHPLAAEERLPLQTLAAQPLILLDLPISRDYFLSLFQARGLSPLIAERTAHVAMLQSLAANGFGYGLLNAPSAAGGAADGKALAARPIADAVAPLRVGLMTMGAERKPRVLQAFEAVCREVAPDLAGASRPA